MDLDEWDELPEDKNHELVDGVLRVVPAATPRYQRVQNRLAYWIDEHLDKATKLR